MNRVISRISSEFNLNEFETNYLILSAPKRYKDFTIEKASGRGRRPISQPSPEVKNLQRFVIREFLSELPVHDAAYAYVESRSIKDNAEIHARARYLLKMDFEAFFPSIKSHHFIKHLNKYGNSQFTAEEARSLALICFRRRSSDYIPYLSIGAPSSPFISNTMLYDFDVLVEAYCLDRQIKYTRYADDLSFSTNQPHFLKGVPDLISDMLESLDYPKLSVNSNKTIHTSRKRNRKVTGLTLSNSGYASIGRGRKRNISAMVHHAKLQKLNDLELKVLQGQLGFIKFIDPTFFAKLKSKYGSEIVEYIQRTNFKSSD